MVRSYRCFRLLIAAALASSAAVASAGPVPITSVAGFPNERLPANGEPLPNAIDGNVATFTWTTRPNTVDSPAHLAIGFSAATVGRLRLWKSNNGGGGQNIKNLVIKATTDGGALAGRNWVTVTALGNGFEGSELMDATAVNANGTVTGDIHESAGGDGWASLTFTPVANATGLLIAFSNPQVSPGGCTGLGYPNDNCNHYYVAEFEAWDTPSCGEDADCSDGDACNGAETCNDGTCQAGTPVSCGDCQYCSEGSCVADLEQDGNECDDGDACTQSDVCAAGSCSGSAILCDACESCQAGVCAGDARLDGDPCDDGLICTGGDQCAAGSCQGGAPPDCSELDGPCSVGVCTELAEGCEAQPANGGESCSDGDACTSGETCSAGECVGGDSIDCNDNNSCTADSCDPLEAGCINDVSVESPACDSCDDGIDNDDDGDVDGEELDAGTCVCTTLCQQYRFAATVTFAPTSAKRFSSYTGSDVTFASTPGSAGDSHAGLCGTNAAIRAGGRFGILAVTGSTDFGKGATLDPDIAEDDLDSGSVRQIDIREQFVSSGGAERIRSAAPLVGPGQCSQDAGQMCVLDDDCGIGNSCDQRGRLDTPANPYVDRSGTADNHLRCVEAQAAVAPEALLLSGFGGTVAGFDDGSAQLRTSGASPIATVNVGAGQQVIYVRRVAVSGKTTLRIVGTATTTLLIRVAGALRLGGEAQVELAGGLTADRVLWIAEGTRGGRPKLLRGSHFRGTLMAPDRRGILIGGAVTLDGATKSQRLHIGQGSTVNHVPFEGLLQ